MFLNRICVISTTEEETTEFKQYLKQHYPFTKQGNSISKLYNYMDETTYLAIWFRDNKIVSHQTLCNIKDISEYERLKSKYFTITNGIIPFRAFKNPELYPEYFI